MCETEIIYQLKKSRKKWGHKSEEDKNRWTKEQINEHIRVDLVVVQKITNIIFRVCHFKSNRSQKLVKFKGKL